MRSPESTQIRRGDGRRSLDLDAGNAAVSLLEHDVDLGEAQRVAERKFRGRLNASSDPG
jgi:hypothetical protein